MTTTMGAGIIFTTLFLIIGRPIMINKLTKTDHGHFEMHVRQAVRYLRQKFQGFFRFGFHTQRNMDLFGNDDHANGGQHAIYCAAREEITQGADLQPA